MVLIFGYNFPLLPKVLRKYIKVNLLTKILIVLCTVIMQMKHSAILYCEVLNNQSMSIIFTVINRTVTFLWYFWEKDRNNKERRQS